MGRLCIPRTKIYISQVPNSLFLKINTWIVAPYKKPERDLPDNEIFNNHLSMVRIRSEHAIGYLKGRLHSLKGLRVNINSRAGHLFATYWITACICIHAYAMQREAEERNDDGCADFDDPFIAEGLTSESDTDSSDRNVLSRSTRLGRGAANRLTAAKACREKLKGCLFRAKEKRREDGARRRRERYGIYSSDESESES